MNRGNSRDWMWSEALQMLAQAERLQREVFRPQGAASLRVPTWEPPVDVLETDHEVLILAALPGVDVDQVEAVIQDGALIIAGERTLPDALRTAVIHRLELPQGRFERRIDLPAGVYGDVQRFAINGCLVITLAKSNAIVVRP
ncbi:MAG: Hsp20/alpha crystallin family protein [Reyranella sp.]|uniref:Hsp20/alpha crystallin family protein n=1 Tax=Reyranella sp. TaxID=1929291 RepID=UPI001AC8ECA6|nr:Hsp20/alpha crystallin family protein [Reyranella sp.]MBN9539792.1 Hsp20/alpha crystallin family protein [Alphaproteobacteria bacterium]MBR2815889.1 Hsp20/alpha crystallin family protein [Reyranella sp.]